MIYYKDILYTVTGPVATITINRPDRLNALRTKTLVELGHAISTAARGRSIGVIVLTGAGEKAFCVGGDIGEMKGLNQKTGRLFVKNLLHLARTILTCTKPLIAKVNGWCLGGGNELQLFCDLTVASDRSVFGQTGPKVGSAPLWGGTQILPSLVGLKRAKEIMFLCGSYSATEAAAVGMINRVVPEAELDPTVQSICQNLLKKSPQSLRLLKMSLHREIIRQLPLDLKLLEGIYGSTELREGMSAFLERREPKFR